jgi:acetoin utilization deacetylase AcuC-like enzyme
MQVLFNRKFLKHNQDSQAEGAYRLAGFPETYGDEDCDGEAFITLIHPEPYRDMIKSACMHGERLAEVLLAPESYEAAITAVGLSVLAAEQCDFAAVRPPGHHAERASYAGFCFFNNIAIAAQHLVNQGKRVFIFDFDGHHGDGTQSIFYDTDQVFYASIHQAFTFPMTGSPTETGQDQGEGYTLNIPLMPGAGEDAFFQALDAVLARAREFEPDVLAVSAGFDGLPDDLLLRLNYTVKSFYECGFRLRRAFPRVFAVLEGGYHAQVKECVEAFVSGVNVGSRPIRNTFDHNMSIG